MRLIATLLLTVLGLGLYAADFSAANLTAIAEKAKTMKVGESDALQMTIDGKVVYVGMVMGANGVTLAGNGVPAGSYKFLYTGEGLVVQSTQAGQTKTVTVANSDNSVQPAPDHLSRAFGAGAVSTWSAVQEERLDTARKADQQARTADQQVQGKARIDLNHRRPRNEESTSDDLNSLSFSISAAFIRIVGGDDEMLIPSLVESSVIQTKSITTMVINDASNAANP